MEDRMLPQFRSIKCVPPFFVAILLPLFMSSIEALVNSQKNCFIGLVAERPSSVQYAEYDKENIKQYVLQFQIDLCENSKNTDDISLGVSRIVQNNALMAIPHIAPIPSVIALQNNEEISQDQANDQQVYFRIVNRKKGPNSDSYDYFIELVFPVLTLQSSMFIKIVFKSKGNVASYSAFSEWSGQLIVQQKAEIEAVTHHTVQNILNNGDLRNEIICGKLLGHPEPKVIWECAGNQNFWLKKTKDSPKEYGPHTQANLSLYEFGDDKDCQGDGRFELVCKISNEIMTDGVKTEYKDQKTISTMQVIQAVDNDKATCYYLEKGDDGTGCQDYISRNNDDNNRIQFNSTHGLKSFMEVLKFKSSHLKGEISICEKVMQNLACNFFASDCKERAEDLFCRKECEMIITSCSVSEALPLQKRFCDYFPMPNRQKTCRVDFLKGLSLFDNKTQVSVTNNSVYKGSFMAPDNQTCEKWSDVETKFHLLRGAYSQNYCRATNAPEDNILRCYNKFADTYIQCWPEKPEEPDSGDIHHLARKCDFTCKLQEGIASHWKVVLTALCCVVAMAIIILVLIYCCCCKRPSVRMVAHDRSSFPDMKLRQNPMYAPSTNQSRVLPNTPDPSLGMGPPDIRGSHPRFPNVMQASRNRYVPTPENSLGRSGQPAGPNFRFSGGFRPPTPAIPGGPMSRGPPPPVGFGYALANRDANPLAQFEYDRNKIQYIEDIGSGAFGYVFRAKAPGLGRRDMSLAAGGAPQDPSFLGTEVAVKMLKDDATEDQMADFVNEAKLMSSFNHPNIIKLLGVCSVGKPFCLLLEYMKNRDLSDFLRKNGPESDLDVKARVNLSIADLILICQQVASGMSYISEKNYIHRDLATRNCLVSESMAVKISDFGLSQFIGTDDYSQVDDNDAIPIRWIAPEALITNKFVCSIVSIKKEHWS